MISTFVKPVWLGYSQTGGPANLRMDELGGRLLIIGGEPTKWQTLWLASARESLCSARRYEVFACSGFVDSRIGRLVRTLAEQGEEAHIQPITGT